MQAAHIDHSIKVDCQHIDEAADLTPIKSALVIGQTGAGKTTMLNAILNNLFGTDINDQFRYELVNEEEIKKQKKSETNSMTDSLTCYHIPDLGQGFRFNIIDTPGLLDSRGIQRDDLNVNLIMEYINLQGIKIDFVFLVFNSTCKRLLPPQKYVINRI